MATGTTESANSPDFEERTGYRGAGPSASDISPFDASLLKRRLLSGSAWAMAGKVGAALIGLASNVLLVRLLTPQEFGSYLLVLSVVSLGAVIGSLGLNKAVVRFVAESLGLDQHGRTKRAIGMVLVLGLVGVLGVSLAYLLVGGFLVTHLFNAPALATVVGLTAGWIAVSTAQEIFAETFRGFHDIRLATLFGSLAVGNSAGLLMRVLLLAGLVALWWTGGRTDLTTVLLIMVGAGAFSMLVSGWLLYTKTTSLPGSGDPATSRLSLREIFGVSGPLLINNLTLFVLIYSDIWILAAFRTQEEVAIYGAAARFVVLVTMPLMIVNAVLPPVVAEMYARGEKGRLERTMRPLATLTGIPSLLALVTFVVAGGPILGFLYGDFYRSGAVVLALLSVGKLAAVWAGSCGLTLQMTGHQTLMMWISIASGLLFVVGALLVVKDYGATGIASVGAASIVFQNVVMVLVAKKKTGIWTHVMFSAPAIRKLLAKR